jgi:eukaryotic-like serine/threonine-protein kinase
MPLLPGAKLDGYEVLGLLGAGGMGEVYRARDPVLKREVAIKVLPSFVTQNPDRLRRFEQEAQAAAALNHPNILAVYHFGVFEGVPYLVSELLVGETLRQQLERGPLPVRKAIDTGVQVAHGMAAAHERGIVHRDLKPENLFVTKDGRVKILDFGLAKLTQSQADSDAGTPTMTHATEPGVVMGTAGYMSPEQVRGKPVDHRADIFAFGAILYEMLAGKRAFQRSTSADTMAAILNEDPPGISQIVQSTPPGLQRVVHRCLEKSPEQRFQSASDLAFALEALSESGISSSTPISAPGRRRPGKAIACATGAVVILGTFATVLYLHRKSRSDHSPLTLTHSQITFLGDAYEPAISPDGKSVVYVTRPPGEDMKLMLQDLSGGPSLELMHARWFFRPTWAPNGSELLLAATTEEQAGEIFVVSRLGGTPRGVARGGYSCWLPGGTQIILSFQNGDAGIVLVDLATGGRKVLPKPTYELLMGLTCSIKTGRLLMVTKTGARFSLWSMQSDGSEQRKLVEAESGVTLQSARWTPAGDAVYYFRKAGDTADLMRLPFSNDAKEPSVLVSGLETSGDFTLSDDGSQLAYTRDLVYSNLWLADLPGAGSSLQPRATPLTSGTLLYGDPAISPDNRSVAFTRGSGVKGSIYKIALDGGQPIQLTSFAASQTWSPAWSPDGQEIAFVSNQAGSEKVWIVNSSGGAPRVLDKTDASDTNDYVTWSPNPFLMYSTRAGHNLRRLNVETQREELLFSKDAHGWMVWKPAVSPDGKKIAIGWNRPPALGAWLITGEGASASLLYAGVIPFGWSSDGNSIYAFAHREGREILQLRLGESNKPKSVVALPGPILSGTVSPDGRKVIVSVGEEKSDVWLLKDFDPEVARAN